MKEYKFNKQFFAELELISIESECAIVVEASLCQQ